MEEIVLKVKIKKITSSFLIIKFLRREIKENGLGLEVWGLEFGVWGLVFGVDSW